MALAVMLAVTMMPQVAAAGSDEQDMLPGPSSAVQVPEDPENGIPLIIVNAAGNKSYRPANKTVTVKVRIK